MIKSRNVTIRKKSSFIVETVGLHGALSLKSAYIFSTPNKKQMRLFALFPFQKCTFFSEMSFGGEKHPKKGPFDL